MINVDFKNRTLYFRSPAYFGLVLSETPEGTRLILRDLTQADRLGPENARVTARVTNGPYISVAAIKSGARHWANMPVEWLISPWRTFKAADKTISAPWRRRQQQQQ